LTHSAETAINVEPPLNRQPTSEKGGRANGEKKGGDIKKEAKEGGLKGK